MNYVNIIDRCISECPCVHLDIASLWENYQFNTGVYILLRGLGEEALTNLFLCDSSSITVRRPCSVSVSMPTSVTYVMVEISPLGRVIR